MLPPTKTPLSRRGEKQSQQCGRRRLSVGSRHREDLARVAGAKEQIELARDRDRCARRREERRVGIHRGIRHDEIGPVKS